MKGSQQHETGLETCFNNVPDPQHTSLSLALCNVWRESYLGGCGVVRLFVGGGPAFLQSPMLLCTHGHFRPRHLGNLYKVLNKN